MYIKFWYNFFLPDVASVAIAAFTFVSIVHSVPLTLVEGDEADKVKNVLIDAGGEITNIELIYVIMHHNFPFV